MTSFDNKAFFQELEKRQDWVNEYILQPRFVNRFQPEDVQSAVTAYIRYGGKRLRPAILMFSCGVVGGEEKRAIPAAAAVEIFHTWTLVHDDIIDRDSIRRGSPTVHVLQANRSRDGRSGFKLENAEAQHYGISISILTGDIQHGWGISMMTELTSRNGIDPQVTLDLIDELDTKVLNTLVEGEVLDIQFSYRDIDSLTPEMIEDMLWKKTGALYEFCGRAGASIGLGEKDRELIDEVSSFASKCGTAFQLQDDILGLIGKQTALGKPIGSDLREGKRTLIVYDAYQNSTDAEKEKLMSVLGNPNAAEWEIQEIIGLLKKKGGIDEVKARAQELIKQAMGHLARLPDNHYKKLLAQWAEFMILREF